ncbi:MAG TPA: hypothetical protein VMR66_01505 [Gemmatimonadota bacterium]|nr:hypothetical protein [Gemmatimonadota bacterium]
MPRLPSSRRPEHPGLARALVAALAVHAVVLLFVRLPADHGRTAGGPLVLVPQPVAVERPAADRGLLEPGATAEDGTRARTTADPPAERPATAIPAIRESPAATPERTIPSTTLGELRASTLPLVASPEGTIGRRRLERSPEAIAAARAESLLFARMAGLVVPARDIGAIGLANGGITVAVPWQGFLPADRYDGAWRAKRCAGSGDGDSDKAGEAEARRAQCG